MMRPDLKVFRQFLLVQDELKKYNPGIAFTTKKEVDYITEVLDLTSMTNEELDLLRDFIVLFYEYLRKGLSHEDDLWFKYWNAMMSVTAIIDNVSEKKSE